MSTSVTSIFIAKPLNFISSSYRQDSTLLIKLKVKIFLFLKEQLYKQLIASTLILLTSSSHISSIYYKYFILALSSKAFS